DLQKKLTFIIELQDLVFRRSILDRCASEGRPAPRNPDVIFVIDEDAVFVIRQRPFVSVSRTAPALQKLSRWTEFHHHRRRLAARSLIRNRAGTMDDPYIVFGIRPHAGSDAD